jgi:1,4-dihydroxy-2-naphthoyl-CoA hydrolase
VQQFCPFGRPAANEKVRAAPAGAAGTIHVPTWKASTMSIWFQPFSLEDIQSYSRGSMVEHLDLRFTEIGPDFLRGTLPVDSRTTQPFGLLHGGASAVLAETLGSVAAQHCVDMGKFYCVGLEINANHIRSARSGRVTGTARPIHIGRRSHVWDIRIEDDQGRLTCISRLTVSVLEGSAQSMAGGPRS